MVKKITQNNSGFYEEIFFGDICLAIIIRSEFKDNGIKFFTPGEFSQQLGYMNRPAGYIIEPHVHKSVERKIEFTKEVLFIRSGKLRVDFYSKDKIYLESRNLDKGDIILLSAGGHGFEVIEDCEMIEVKQGPYAGDKDKERF